jgi:hypothetical protein
MLHYLCIFSYRIISTALNFLLWLIVGEHRCIYGPMQVLQEATDMANPATTCWQLQDGIAGEACGVCNPMKCADNLRLPSFCFGTISEFAFKMLSASHLDRLMKRPNYKKLLSFSEIQKRVCRGEDLYGMLPEAYHWSDLIGYWRGADKEVGNINLPLAVLEDSQRFSYLLPGGCTRMKGAFRLPL